MLNANDTNTATALDSAVAPGTGAKQEFATQQSQETSLWREKASDVVICADMPLDTAHYPIRELLSAFRELAQTSPDARLVLAGRRSSTAEFSVWNFLEENELQSRVEFLPYYERCAQFPLMKVDAPIWIGRSLQPSLITAANIAGDPRLRPPLRPKLALFFTIYHPEKFEGTSTNLRNWLGHLKAAGYRIHLVYYGLDRFKITDEIRSRARAAYDLYQEVDIVSRLVGRNSNGLNVHVDDWCGAEALEAVTGLSSQYEYDVAITNYAFMSAILDVVPAYTKKILLTHDSFANRNRRMLAQGYSSSGWMSLTEDGERLAFQRADVVVAMQEDEAAHFRSVCGNDNKVVTVCPVFPPQKSVPRRICGRKIRIGYMGSSNWVNEENLGIFLRAWLDTPGLPERSEIVLAGTLDMDLLRRLTANGHEVLQRIQPIHLGPVDELRTFFDRCDIIINPDRGGTGIKIKTLEALAAGMPVLTTKGGAAGIGSWSRYHSAQDAVQLANLVAELCKDPALIGAAQAECVRIYDDYIGRNKEAMTQLVGPVIESSEDSGSKVSVIIPFYNVERYLADCIESVLNQDHGNLEIILVDDASPDGSLAIAERFAAMEGRVRVIRHPQNRGLGHSRNTGAAHASGDYLLFLDSDDLLSASNSLRKLVAAARSTNSKVTAGACQKLFADGRLEPVDAVAAAGKSNACGGIVNGADAFLAGMQIPNGYYLPPRAWGTLIDREFYNRAALAFPSGEHEDLPHTSFLYYAAASVNYISDIIVNYRVRQDSLSNSAWSNERLMRYVDLWRAFKVNLERFDLQDHQGDAAANLLCHMICRIRDNQGFANADWSTAKTVIRSILPDISHVHYPDTLFWALDTCRDFAKAVTGSGEQFLELVKGVPPHLLLYYYRRRTGLPASLTESGSHCTGDNQSVSSATVEVASIQRARRFERNRVLLDEIMSVYQADGAAHLGSFPAMLTVGDRACYYWAGRTYKGSGTVVDAGCFVGGTTTALVRGLLDNPIFSGNPERLKGLVRVYDLFTVDDDYVRDHLQKHYPERAFTPGDSFLPVFEDNLAAYKTFLDVRPGDVIARGYRDSEDIEILGVDLCKAPAITDFFVRHFYTRLMEGSLVIHQDIVHDAHPHIHLAMLLLEDHFEEPIEVEWGGSFVFKCIRPITHETVLERFGTDLSWYDEVAGNAAMLRRFAEEMLYDANRWVALRTLGVYYANHGLKEEALAIHREVRSRFPQFKVDPITAAKLGDIVEPQRTGDNQSASSAIGEFGPMWRARRFERNRVLLDEIMSVYQADGAAHLGSFPAMLTVGDRACYYWAGRTYKGSGTVVDAGCFVGGTTTALVRGLLDNPIFSGNPERLKGLVRVYDLFTVDDGYVRDHLQSHYPGRAFAPGDSFLPVFEDNLAAYKTLLDVRPGDVIARGYRDSEDIEILGVDLCKAPAITDFFVRHFYTRLIEGSLVIHQDFGHESHPHIQLAMLYLEDHFGEPIEVEGGCSFVFKCVRHILPEIVLERFGSDLSWYDNVAANAAKLRRLAEETLYEGNRWVALLTLGVYYANHGLKEEALAIHREVRSRFPQLKIDPITVAKLGDI